MYIGLHVKCPLFFSDFNGKVNSLDRFSKKFSNIKFHENPSSGRRVISSGWMDRTDRHDETNRCFAQFCERA